jgi:hypothetical protein
MFGIRGGRAKPRTLALAAVVAIVSTLTVSGCSQASSDPSPALLLGGPKTDITVTIPPGWHQVIDSANAPIPEMVAPVTCLGEHEVDCSLALTRIATMIGPTAQAAEHSVEQAVLSGPGVRVGRSLHAGIRMVDGRPGYAHRFVFNNASGSMTCEIATVPSGPTAPDAHGDHEFSVIVVWVSSRPGAPSPDVIDHIVGSADVAGAAA